MAVDESAFSPLENALLEAQAWEPLVADAIQRALDEAPVDLQLEPLGVFALSQVAPPAPLDAASLLAPGAPLLAPGANSTVPQLPPAPPGPPQLKG